VGYRKPKVVELAAIDDADSTCLPVRLRARAQRCRGREDTREGAGDDT
jgi:hypothetical protein